MIFAPLNVAAYLYIPRALRGAAVGLFALLRNEGGSFGTSAGQTITERREIFHGLAWVSISFKKSDFGCRSHRIQFARL
jgi:hypothetical protein